MEVAASIIGSVNSSAGNTPHYIIFGYDKRLPYDVLLISPSPSYNTKDYSKLQHHSFQTIHASVREKLKASREEMTHRQQLHTILIIHDVGDSVMKRSPERSCKLSPKFLGPFLATAKLHYNKLKVLDPSTFISEVVHADRLKKVCSALSPVADTPLSPDSYSSVSPPISTPPSASSCTAATRSTVPPPVSSVSPPDYAHRQKLRSACQV